MKCYLDFTGSLIGGIIVQRALGTRFTSKKKLSGDENGSLIDGILVPRSSPIGLFLTLAVSDEDVIGGC